MRAERGIDGPRRGVAWRNGIRGQAGGGVPGEPPEPNQLLLGDCRTQSRQARCGSAVASGTSSAHRFRCLRSQVKVRRSGCGVPVGSAWFSRRHRRLASTQRRSKCKDAAIQATSPLRRCWARSGLCLALDGDELPAGGGVLTPALALGAVLRQRLAAVEGGEFMHFRVLYA